MKAVDELKTQAISEIADFVTRFTYEDITLTSLFNRTGYAELRNLISETDIELHLKDSPLLVDDWIGFSEDQRQTPSWFIREADDNWTVAFMDKSGKLHREKRFNDKFVACAHFIKMFMEHMTNNNG